MKAIALLLAIAALVAWAVLRREPHAEAGLTTYPSESDDGIQPPDPGLVAFNRYVSGLDWTCSLCPDWQGETYDDFRRHARVHNGARWALFG